MKEELKKKSSKLSYSEFMRIVPRDTARMVIAILNAIKEYKNRSLMIGGSSYESNHSKIIIFMLGFLSESPEYKNLLSENGFNFSKIKLYLDSSVNSSTDYDKLFTENYKLFDIYKDQTLYQTLTPIDLLANAKSVFDSYRFNNIIDVLFPDKSTTTVMSNISRFNKKEKLEQVHDEMKKVYGNLTIDVINYIENVTKIRSYLISKGILADENIAPLSLFLALGYESKEDSEELKSIRNYLVKKGMDFRRVYRVLDPNSDVNIYNELSNVDSNPFSVEIYFKKYFKAGVNASIKEEDITISKIVDNLVNRSFTNTTIVEQVLLKNGIDIKDLDNILAKVEEQKKYDEQLAHQTKINRFYELLGSDEREFIQFVTKTYILLMKKMKNKKHNQEILLNEDDADTLALLIASYYYNLDISVFFQDNGIKLEDIFKLLNISITKEEIMSTELDVNLMISRFGRFVMSGANSNAKNISMNSISYNLCNREFNRSMIIENIYGSLANNGVLSSDFLSKMKKYIENKRNREIENAEATFMAPFLPQVAEYLKILNLYSNTTFVGLSEENARMIAMIMAFTDFNDPYAQNLRQMGFEKSSLERVLKITYNSRHSLDLDFLRACLNQIKGKNNIEDHNLTIRNIIMNLFSNLSEENKIALSRYIKSTSGVSKELKTLNENGFANFEEVFTKFAKDQKTLNEVMHIFSRSNYPFQVFAIHGALRKLNGEEKDEDIVEKALSLSIFKSSNKVRSTLEKLGITTEVILKYMGLDEQFLEDIDYQNYDLDLFYKYREYFKGSDVTTVAKSLFDRKLGGKSDFFERMTHDLGIDYKVIEVETLTGAPYEQSLTIPDRIQLLKGSEVGTLDFDDASSILTFGEVLTDHSKYIYDEVPVLTAIDSGQKSIDTISNIINRSRPQVGKQTIITRVFKKTLPQPTLSKDLINELRQAIERNLKTLFEETLKFDEIRKYMEAYMAKNAEFLSEAEKIYAELLAALSKIDRNDETEYSKYIALSSRLKVIESKISRFKTTNLLMKQEILKINQSLINHFITINALEMARDDLFPLIGSEIALAQGRKTETESLKLSKGVMNLFQALLTRNVSSVEENLAEIRKLNIPDELAQALSQDVQTFVKALTEPTTQAGAEAKKINLHL